MCSEVRLECEYLVQFCFSCSLYMTQCIASASKQLLAMVLQRRSHNTRSVRSAKGSWGWCTSASRRFLLLVLDRLWFFLLYQSPNAQLVLRSQVQPAAGLSRWPQYTQYNPFPDTRTHSHITQPQPAAQTNTNRNRCFAGTTSAPAEPYIYLVGTHWWMSPGDGPNPTETVRGHQMQGSAR